MKWPNEFCSAAHCAVLLMTHDTLPKQWQTQIMIVSNLCYKSECVIICKWLFFFFPYIRCLIVPSTSKWNVFFALSNKCSYSVLCFMAPVGHTSAPHMSIKCILPLDVWAYCRDPNGIRATETSRSSCAWWKKHSWVTREPCTCHMEPKFICDLRLQRFMSHISVVLPG